MAHLDVEAAAAIAADPRAVQMIDEKTREALAVVPELVNNIDRFFAHLATHAPDLESLERCRTGEVALAFACADGNPAALGDFERNFLQPALHALGRMRLGGGEEDVLQEVRARLLMRTSSDAPKVLQFSGRGPLAGWVRVAATRAALSALRASGAEVRDSDEALADLAAAGQSPELLHLKRTHSALFKEAFERAFAALDTEDRSLLRMHLLDGLSIDELGPLFGVHRATAARRIVRAKEFIWQKTRDELSARLQLGEGEFESLMGVLLSQLDLSIARVLESGDRKQHD
jgi:RNA polymerase sigma-70 factor (ECF subfamily)